MTTHKLAALGAVLLSIGVPTVAVAAPKDCQVAVTEDYPGPSLDREVTVTSDRAEVSPEGVSVFMGGVEVSQGPRRIEAEQLSYDPATRRASIEGRATYSEPRLRISAEDFNVDPATGEGELHKGFIELPARPAQAEADRIRATGEGRLKLDDVRYTTCLDDDPDWQLKAGKMELDVRESRGEARDVKLEFKGVNLAYLPYISFPLDDTRKSGLLFPELRNSDRTGTELRVPFYWNIAPNYDATITPRLMSDRGLQWITEFRYLRPQSRGQLDFEYLPSDDETSDERRFTRWQHGSEFGLNWRASADIAEVSDRTYFEDLGTGIADTSQTHLLRNVELAYAAQNWRFILRGRNYQTIDTAIEADEKPYQRLPQLLFAGSWDDGLLGLSYDFDSELVNFRRDEGVDGFRAIAEPGLRLPFEGPGYFLVPKLSWRFTGYSLDDTEPDETDGPSFDAAMFSLDGGLLFERQTPSGKYVQTLQPRVLYAHIPFEDQQDVPIFDAGAPDFNTVQLFRPNRFVGGDRLGDTDQVSVGITTRLLNEASGREFLTATLGQIYYLSDRNVVLPGETVDTDNESDLVAELGLDIFKNWNANLGYQWDLEQKETSLAEARIQYRPASNRVANATYRYRPGLLEQIELSLGWPLTNHWSFIGQLEYSLRDETTIERLMGVQYESCCWAARVASQRSISNRDGSSDTTVMLQLEFKGLAGLGSGARNKFENDILGYSVYE